MADASGYTERARYRRLMKWHLVGGGYLMGMGLHNLAHLQWLWGTALLLGGLLWARRAWVELR